MMRPRPRKAKNHLQIVKNHLFLSKIIHEMPLYSPPLGGVGGGLPPRIKDKLNALCIPQ